MIRVRKCLVSTCCRWRFNRAAKVEHEHPCNVFLPQSVARDHAIEVAFAAAEAAQVSAANASRAVQQVMHFRRLKQQVVREAAVVASSRVLVEAPVESKMCGSFTMYEMSRIGRELVRANSA